MRALKRRAWRARRVKERGQILVMFGLSMMMFLGFAALTVDIGFLLLTQRSYQNAADEAALAGSVYLTRPILDPCADTPGAGSKQDCARAAAWRYLAADLDLAIDDAYIDANLKGTNITGLELPTNGGGPAYRLWVSTPPGPSATMSTVADEKQVLFVRIDRMRSPFIAGVLGIGDLNVSAWATAGVLPDRWAVMTLRRGRDNTEIDAGPSDTTDFKLSGTGATLTVVDGDVGGNWGMKLAAGSILKVMSSPLSGDEANVYLVDYTSCGNSCWSSGQVVDGSNAALAPKKLPAFVNDPDYDAPLIPGSTWPNGLIDNLPVGAGGGPDIPNGDTGANRYAGAPPNIRIREGSVGSGGTCVGPDGTQESAPRLGPGTYGDIRVDTGNCVILDPVRTFDDPELGLDDGDPSTPINSTNPVSGVWNWVPNSQYPGIFYVTGNFDIQTNALIVGDGVTVIMRPQGAFRPSGGGAMDLNRGKVADLVGDQRLGAWTTKGETSYSGSPWSYQTAREADKQQYGVGIAMYVLKPAQVGITDTNGTDVINVSSGSALAWNGVTYAPQDNVKIAGQPNHDGIGQLISWTFAFVGNTNVTQTFDGVGDGLPYLIEPCVVVAGSCQ